MCWGVEEVRGRCGEKCRGCGEVCWGCGGRCREVLGKVRGKYKGGVGKCVGAWRR